MEIQIVSGPGAPIPTSTTLTKLQYMDRFTDEELTAIYTAARTSPAIEIWVERFKLAESVSLTDPRLLAGLQMLVDAELLTAERMAAISDTGM